MIHNFIKNIVRQVLNEEYNRDIMKVNVEWMKVTYDKFNKMYWGGSLPSDLSFSLNGRLKSTFAKAVCIYTDWQEQPDGTYTSEIKEIVGIEFSTMNEGEVWVFENTMLHEMIHIADFYFHPEHFSLIYKNGRTCSNFKKGGYDTHGNIFFLKEAARLSQYGWNIEKMVTAEEEASLRLTSDYEEKIKKNRETKIRKQKKERERYNLLRSTIEAFNEKGAVLTKYIANKTNNFTQPMPDCAINIGQLKVVFSRKGDWQAQVLTPDKENSSNVKYKVIVYIGEGLLSAISKGGLGSGINNVDTGLLFKRDYDEMYEFEDKYGF
jgi:hypothetical protein